MIGLSTAPTPTPINTLAPQVPTSTPQGIASSLYDTGFNLFTNQVSDNAGGTLTYPLDTPKYIMTFTISQYVRNSLNQVGQFTPATGYPAIILPLPEQLVDVDSVNWAEWEAGFFTGAAINTGVQSPGAALTAAVGLGVGAAVAGGLAQAAVGAASGLGSLAGVAPNQFVTLLMRGPKYKRHRFTWTLAPNNFKEADQLRQICLTFRNAMAPGQYFPGNSNIPILWTYPKIFYVRLYPNSKFMYKFKPCIVDNFAVNYNPAGRAAFSRNGTGTVGDNPPTAVQIQMSLIELEFWTEGNYDATNNPDNYYSNTVPTFSNTATQMINTIESAIPGWTKNINPTPTAPQ